MAATWKLDARARRGGASAQSAAGHPRGRRRRKSRLKAKTEEVAAQMSAQHGGAAPAPRPAAGLTRPGDEPLPRAVEAMGRAAASSIA